MKIPGSFKLNGLCKITAAQPDEDQPQPRRFEMSAYTGASVDIGLGVHAVFDLSDMEIPSRAVPILCHHDPRLIAGYSEQVENDGSGLRVEGRLLSSADGLGVAALSDEGFPWQASVGLGVKSARLIDDGEEEEINGRMFAGPVVRVSSVLREVSFVPMGADANTSAVALSASAEQEQSTLEVEMTEKSTQPTAEEIRQADAKRISEVSAAFSEDPKFALEAITAGLNVTEAKARYADILIERQRVERENHARELAEVKAEASRSNPPIKAAQKSGSGGNDGETYTARWNRLIRAEMDRGLDKARATRTVIASSPETHKGMLLEANAGRRVTYVPSFIES